ncbi:MAG: HU family DNA-binding protein [Paludibacteraceae bacterium]|nr:HU family DNA-binding protein [Paludibacteraceae bacterium]
MTTKELSNQIAAKIGMTKRQSELLLSSAVDVMVEALNEDKTVVLQNFGTLSIKERRQREVMNPKTGEKRVAESKRVITFAANPTLKQQVR